MIASILVRSFPTKVLHRWRAIRFRTRVVLASLAIASLVGGWIVLWKSVDPWPARLVLQTSRETWSLAFSPDGRTFLTSNAEGITPWNATTGGPGKLWLIGEKGFAVTGAYSPDGRTFAAAVVHNPRNVMIDLIDTTTGRPRATLRTRHPSIYHVAFDSVGRTVRAFLGDGPDLLEVATWDATSGEETSRHAITAPTRGSATAISPDGRTLAFIPFRTSTVQLWDLETDRPLGGLIHPSLIGTVGCGLAFSSDGQTLATGREEGAIDLWNLAPRKLLKTLPGHSGGYVSVGLRFSPDGQTLASTGNDTGRKSALGQLQSEIGRSLFGSNSRTNPEVIVVDVATGKRLVRAASSLHPFYSPDGRTIVTRQQDFSVRLRDLPHSPRGSVNGPRR